MLKLIKYIFYIALIAGVVFFFRVPLDNFKARLLSQYFPCKTLITYEIKSFDERFGLTEADFLKALRDAEAIWEKPLGKELFKYEAGGNLKVNLVYDSRQEATAKLKEMGLVLKTTRASYDSIRIKYDSMVATYSLDRASFERRVALFETRKSAYEAEVARVNKRGGADEATAQRLNTEKDYLNRELSSLNLLQVKLNNDTDNINALSSSLNQLARDLNINVRGYNEVGGELGQEFEEGTYTSGPDGQEIDIYQFDNRTKLVRVLAHELGHALGLDHIDDPKAIMYRLNNGINEKLTAGDLKLVKSHCGIE